MLGVVREWNRVSASLEKQRVSSRSDKLRGQMAYGDRGILSLCSISRCNMSAAQWMSAVRAEKACFRWEGARKDRLTYEAAEMV